VRSAERKLGVCRRLADAMPDRRDASRIRHAMFEMVMARVCAIACGHEDAVEFHTLLNVQWITSEEPQATREPDAAALDVVRGPPLRDLEALIGLGQIGYVRGINAKLAEIESSTPEHATFVKERRPGDDPGNGQPNTRRSRSMRGGTSTGCGMTR
jgi:hypothetical protein